MKGVVSSGYNIINRLIRISAGRPGLRITLTVILVVSVWLTLSCEKEEIFSDSSARLVFSTDTLLFDTIFTSIGSATRHFKVINPYSKSLKISSLFLAGETDSPYRINVDGIAGSRFSDLLIRGGDSIFIFVETTIDPLGIDSPMIVEDSIVFYTNGNMQDVKLLSWGQDVNLLTDTIFKTATLTPEKPYLVHGFMMVDTGQILTLLPGVRIHFTKNSGLSVAGTILAEGEFDAPVVFEGARTEASYRNIAGQWEGIRIVPLSEGNRFIYARIRNAVTGITADHPANQGIPSLYLANSRIENMTFAGVFSTGAFINSYNTVFSNCGYHALSLNEGGNYTFNHCTVANYWRFSSRRTPSVLISNVYEDSPGTIVGKPLSFYFGNSIIHGSMRREIGYSLIPDANPDVTVSHSLLNVEDRDQSPINFIDCIFDPSPGFIDPAQNRFKLNEDSPAINAGDPEIGNLFPFDFDGRPRPNGSRPDAGAYEWYEEDL